jgi:hypothetical protein
MQSRARYCYFVAPTDGDTVSGTIDIDIAAWKTPKLYLDGVYQGRGYYWSWDTTLASNGVHEILADCFGATDVIYVTVDNGYVPPPNEAPIVTITNPTEGSTVSDTVTISVTVDDEDSLVADIYIDGSFVASANSYNWDTTGYADGVYDIYAEATDSGSLTGSDSVSVTVENTVTPPPNEAPIVTITNPAAGSTVSDSVTISVTVTDDADTLLADIYIDGSFVATANSYEWDTTAYADGSYDIYAEATDSGSLTDSDSISVTVDNSVTPPPSGHDVFTGTVEYGVDSWHYFDAGFGSIDALLEWGNSYDVDMYLYRPSDYNNYLVRAYTTSNPETMSYNADEAGMWGIRVVMYSSRSNPTDYTLTVDYTPNTPDTTAPTCTITAPTNGETVYKTKYITVDATDDRQIDYVNIYVDGSLVATDSASPYSYGWDTTAYADGGHTIDAIAYDGAGNSDSANQVSVTVDQSAAPATDVQKYAVIVGISDYKAINDLSYCDEDASDWYDFITGSMNVPTDHVWVFGDGHTSNYPQWDGYATEANVKAALENMISIADDDDEIYFITSGHGNGDGNWNSYLCMWDCYSGEDGEDGDLNDYELASIIGGAVADKIFVFVDHCYSGGMGDDLMALGNAAHIVVATTCTEDGYGWDDSTSQNGMWTHYFLEASWIDHFGSDTSVSLEDVFAYAHSIYPKSGGDEPQLFDGDSGTPMVI